MNPLHRLAVLVVAVFATLWLVHMITTQRSGFTPYALTSQNKAQTPDSLQGSNSLLQSPQNASLGFSKIFFVGPKTRFDFDDAIWLQSSSSQITMEKYNSITTKDLEKSTKGLPPSSSKFDSLANAAHYRSHANVWQQMIVNKWETVLILESDALWDVNVRQIMGYFSNGLEKIINRQKERSDLENAAKPDFLARKGPLKATENDPYLHKAWDIIQFGGCHENTNNMGENIHYLDPHAPSGAKYVDGTDIQENTRVIRWGNELKCSAGYALSRSGAMKLLLRGALDLNLSLENLIAEQVQKQALEAYSVFPVVFSQWKFRDNLGVNYKNVPIPEQPDIEKQDAESDKAAWKQARLDMSVWEVKKEFEMSKPKNGALTGIKTHLYADTLDKENNSWLKKDY